MVVHDGACRYGAWLMELLTRRMANKDRRPTGASMEMAPFSQEIHEESTLGCMQCRKACNIELKFGLLEAMLMDNKSMNAYTNQSGS